MNERLNGVLAAQLSLSLYLYVETTYNLVLATMMTKTTTAAEMTTTTPMTIIIIKKAESMRVTESCIFRLSILCDLFIPLIEI